MLFSARMMWMFGGLFSVLLTLLPSWIYEPGVPAPPMSHKQAWVDSVYQAMSVKQRLGQLLMVAAYSNKDEAHVLELEKWTQEGVGGFIFFQGGPVRQSRIINRLQSKAQIPLLMGMDAEWGPSMRLDSTLVYPHALTVGATRKDSLAFALGLRTAWELRQLGIHMNMAPVADVNNNPQNPVIGWRSFGSDPQQVSHMSVAYARGLRKGGVIPVGKHFPGHGDTDKDSHKTLPVVHKSVAQLQQTEWPPFVALIQDGLEAMMIAHMDVPQLTGTPGVPTTLSARALDWLKDSLGFNGVNMTDAMNMQGVAAGYPAGEAEVKAFLAGNDILLFPRDVRAAVLALEKAWERKEISPERLAISVKKILGLKYDAGLAHRNPIKIDGLTARLNDHKGRLLQKEIYARSLTVLSNKQSWIPIREPERLSILVLEENARSSTFAQTCRYYASTRIMDLPKQPGLRESEDIMQAVASADRVVLVLKASQYPARQYGLNRELRELSDKVYRSGKGILVLLGSPYALDLLPEFETALLACEDVELTRLLLPQVIFGAEGASGRLPVQVNGRMPQGMGVNTPSLGKLKIGIPEESGMDPVRLQKLDSLALELIQKRAAPGCQVLVARNNRVVYYKSFGNFTYDALRPVTNTDVYDLASITKIAGTLPVVMDLYGKGKLDLDKPIRAYLPEFKGSGKDTLTLMDILTHQAGLTAWIPFWARTQKIAEVRNEIYSSTPSREFPIRVAQGLYMKSDYVQTVWDSILTSPLDTTRSYKYSDLGFIIAQRICRPFMYETFEDYVFQHFYGPMGLTTMGYKPLERLEKDRIAPTEYDKHFRKQLIQGDVHDPAAAMLGGVAGHAGLFSNAFDLAVLFNTMLQGGSYAGRQYWSPQVLTTFTSAPFPQTNRRGIGFDKPDMRPDYISPCSSLASEQCYGHTGFTGTCVWVDPRDSLVFVFLSNRVHPSASNTNLIKENYRTRMQTAAYLAMTDPPCCQNNGKAKGGYKQETRSAGDTAGRSNGSKDN